MSSAITTGEKPGMGAYSCRNCGQRIDLGAYDKMPPCPRCGNTTFNKQ